MKKVVQYIGTMTSIGGYALATLFALVIIAPEVMGSRVHVSVRPAPVYTREECAALWAHGAVHVFGVGTVPLQPLVDVVEALRLHTATRDGVLVNQAPRGEQP